MKTITFSTGNQRKLTEASQALAPYGITINPMKLEIDEIQHKDSREITKAKARAAYDVVHHPVVVSDTSWHIPALNGFPGGYMKDIAAWFDVDDWVRLLRPYEDKTIVCAEHIAFFDGEELKHFEALYSGQFIDTPRGHVGEDISFERLIILYGNKTMAEQIEAGDIASAGEDLLHWKQFGEWYAARS